MTCQRAVAVLKRGEAGMAFELFVERAAPPQHAFENFGGDPSDGEAGRIARTVIFFAIHPGPVAQMAGRSEINPALSTGGTKREYLLQKAKYRHILGLCSYIKDHCP
jgi:hypothetical protein